MALVKSRFGEDRFRGERRRFDDWALREPVWHDRFLDDWPDWPKDWPNPRDVVERFWKDTDRWWNDWPADWPKMDSIMPRFSSHLDRMDPSWRNSDFWRDIYPKWAEPIFKEGIDVKTNIVNDEKRFAVDIDAYQFKPEELQVKTLDDTLVIEGRHEDVKDTDNFTKMYFVRKYQLPRDIDPQTITSAIDSNGRLTVEANKRYQAIEGRERTIPIEGSSRRQYSPRSSSYSPRDRQEFDRESRRGQEDTYRSNYLRDERRGTDERRGSSDRRFETTNGRSSPLPPANDYRRTEYENKTANESGMRYEARREEYREARNGFETRTNGLTAPVRNGYPAEYRSASRQREDERERQNGYRSEERRGSRDERNGAGSRQDYRVDTPGSGITKKVDDDARSESRSESVRSVRILRKTFN